MKGSMENVALILEGGGMRGLYTAGVLDLFIEKGIEIKYCVGVSAGACQGVSYVSKQLKRNYRVNINYIKDKRYFSVRNWVRTGSLFGMDMLLNKIPNELEPFDYEVFKNSEGVFKIGVTNCETGLAEYYEVKDFREDGYDTLQASISLPLVAQIVEYDGKSLLDGGIADPIPVRQAIKDGNEKHVIILTQHKGYQKSRTKTVPLLKKKYKAYPKFVEAMEKRHEVYNETLSFVDQLEKEGKCFVIRPSMPLNIGRFETNPEKLKGIYEQGYKEAAGKYEELCSFLEK